MSVTPSTPLRAYKGDEPYVFVSYAHHDEVRVREDLAWLQASDIRFWFDEGIEVGSHWRDEIATALQGAALVLFYVSPAAVASDNCRREINLADSRSVPILTVHLEATELPAGLDLTLSERQALFRHRLEQEDYRSRLGARLRGLLGEATTRSAQPPAAAPTVPAPSTPRERTADYGASPKRWRWLLPAIGALLVLSLAALWFATRVLPGYVQPADLTVAVLPFEDAIAEQDSAELVRRVSDAIAQAAASTAPCTNGADCGYRATARAESFRLAPTASLAEVREAMEVNFVITGSVARSGDGDVIAVELNRIQGGPLVWSRTYSAATYDDAESIDDVAVHVAHMAGAWMQLDALTQTGETVGRVYAAIGMFEGIDALLASISELIRYRVGGSGDIRVAERLLRQSLEDDEWNVLPYTALAQVYTGRLDDTMPLAEARTKWAQAVEHGEQAVARDRWLGPEDRIGINWQKGQGAVVLLLDYALGQRELEATLDVLPRNPWPYYYLSTIALREGRRDAAASHVQQAARLHGGWQQPVLHLAVGSVWTSLGEYERALEESTSGLRLALEGRERAILLRQHARALLALERRDGVLATLDEAWDIDGATHPDDYPALYLAAGARERAEEIMARLPLTPRNAAGLARAHLQQGDHERTFEALELAVRDHDTLTLNGLRLSSRWDPIRSDPRFAELMALVDSLSTYTDQFVPD